MQGPSTALNGNTISFFFMAEDYFIVKIWYMFNHRRKKEHSDTSPQCSFSLTEWRQQHKLENVFIIVIAVKE